MYLNDFLSCEEPDVSEGGPYAGMEDLKCVCVCVCVCVNAQVHNDHPVHTEVGHWRTHWWTRE